MLDIHDLTDEEMAAFEEDVGQKSSELSARFLVLDGIRMTEDSITQFETLLSEMDAVRDEVNKVCEHFSSDVVDQWNETEANQLHAEMCSFKIRLLDMVGKYKKDGEEPEGGDRQPLPYTPKKPYPSGVPPTLVS
jgi:hypothetical protein